MSRGKLSAVIARLCVRKLGESGREELTIIQYLLVKHFSQKFVNWYQAYYNRVAKNKNTIHLWKNYIKKTFLNLIVMLIISWDKSSRNRIFSFWQPYIFIHFNYHCSNPSLTGVLGITFSSLWELCTHP